MPSSTKPGSASTGGSGSNKKMSISKSGSNQGAVIRKLSTKPAIPVPSPTNPTIDFTLLTPATHSPQPIWPTWTQARAQKEASGGGGAKGAAFQDPDGLPTLPSSLASVSSGWKRLGELFPPGMAEKFLTVTPAEGWQTMHHVVAGAGVHAHRGWNQIVASQFNLILTKRKLIQAQGPEANFLWSHIQPSGSKDGIVRYNPFGKYVCRVFHQGEWKMVVIDDQIPVDASGVSLLPSGSNPSEIWPILLSKVLLKLWPGYDFTEEGSGGGTEILYSLCGWLCQTSVESKSLLSYPYSKSNRPSSPLLPFNPLTDSTPAPPVASTTSAGSRNPSVDMTVGHTRRSSNLASGRQTPTETKSKSKERKPSSASKKDGFGEEDSTPAPPAAPLTTDQLHRYGSRRGELGWYNELVFAAPNSMPGGDATPSGLLFAYTWTSAGSGVEGYPSLTAVLKLEDEQIPKFGTLPYEYDPATNPLTVALTTPITSVTSSPTPASQPGYQKGRTTSVSSLPAGSSPKPVKGAKEVTSPPPAPVAPVTPIAIEESDAATIDLTPPPPRYHCLLLEAFELDSERAELEAASAARHEALANAAAKGGVKGGVVGAKTPSTPSAGAKKPVVAGSPVPPTTAKPTTASGKPRSKKEEEAWTRRAEEEAAAAALESQTRQAKKEEEERARVARAQQRMEAWLRGEEQMLAEEEMAKITPQLKVTDLLTGECVVVRVDSFAEQFPHVNLVRDTSRYAHAQRVTDFWCGKDLKKPYSSTPSPTVFVADPLFGTLPTFVAAQPPPPCDLALSLAQGIPVAAAQALQTHHEKEYASATIIEQAALARRLYVHVEFQTNHQITAGSADCEPLPNIPTTAKPTSGSDGTTTVTPVPSPPGPKGKSGNEKPSAVSKRPVSGGKTHKNAASTVSTDASGGVNLGPLQSQSPPLTWQVQLERFDWSTNRREIVAERRVEGVEGQQEVRMECLEFILPPADPVAIAAAAASSSSSQVSRPGSSASNATSSPRMKPFGSDKKMAPSKSSKEKEKAAALAETLAATPLNGGIVYRIIVQSNCGYTLATFSHNAFELEEGKPGANAQAASIAAGESASSKKDTTPPIGSFITNGGTGLEQLLPSTQIKSLEGSYPAQNPGSYFVLFKYVFEVPTPPPAPTHKSFNSTSSIASDFSVEAEVAAANASPSPSIDKKTAAGRTTTSASKDRLVDKKKAAQAQAQAAADAEAAAIAAALAATQSMSGSSSSSPPSFNKLHLPQTAQQANQALTKSWLHPSKGQPGGGVCAPVSFTRKASTTEPSSISSGLWSQVESQAHPQSTLLGVSLSVQDAALVPFLRLEWINNDTLNSWLVPIGEQYTPTMQFLPNQHGYTLLCSAYIPSYQLFAGKFFVKLFSSRVLSSFNIETLSQQSSFIDEYRSNTQRNLCRLMVSGTTSVKEGKKDEPVSGVLPQGLLHFQVNVPTAGLICKVYDLDESLEHPLSSPPTPLTCILGVSSLVVPVFLATKEVKVLIDISFDALHPTQDVLTHHANLAASLLASATAIAGPPAHSSKEAPVVQPGSGITWTARIISTTGVAVALDKALEDEYLSLKTSWSAGDNGRTKKAHSTRQAFLETRAAQLAKLQAAKSPTLPPVAPTATTGHGKAEKEPAPKKGEPIVVPPIPLPPIVLHSTSHAHPTPILLTEAMDQDRKLVIQQELEKAKLLKLSLERQRECLNELITKSHEDREAGFQQWRSEYDAKTHEAWQERAELRRGLIQQEVEMAELKAILAQQTEATSNLQLVANYDECNASHTPFNDLPTTFVPPTTGKEKSTKDGASGTKKHSKGADTAVSTRFGVAAYLDAIEGALPAIAGMPKWKGGALTSAAVAKVQGVLTEALKVPLLQAAVYQTWKDQQAANPPPPSTTPTPGKRSGDKPTKESKSAALAAAAALAESSPPVVEKSTLGNTLWHALWNTRLMMPKISPSTTLGQADFSAEIALFALTVDQLEKVCEPVKAHAQYAAQQQEKRLNGGEEEKTNEEVVVSRKSAGSPAGQKSSKSSKAAAIAAAQAAAALPPPIDFTALENWTNQIAQYASLYEEIKVPEAHEEHPAPIESPTHRPPSSDGNTPTSPISSVAAAVDETSAAPAPEWFGPTSVAAGEGASSDSNRPESTTGTVATSPTFTLAPRPDSSFLTTETIHECSSLVAAVFGRDTVTNWIASLPPDVAAVMPTTIYSSSSSSSSPPSTCCGLCFLNVLFMRSASLMRLASGALQTHQLEVDRQNAILRAQEDAAREKELTEKGATSGGSAHGKKPSQGTGSNKKKATPAPPKTAPLVKAKH